MKAYHHFSINRSITHLVVAFGLIAIWGLRPVPAGELELARASSLIVEARDGTVLRELVSRDGYAAPAHLSELPPQVWQAFVAAEDSDTLASLYVPKS